jgi:MHS family proline/betaine transporter-like MFS transporter
MLNHNAASKLLIATTIGSIFEIFDFITFVFLTPVLADVFFPYLLESKALWLTYLTITISYLLRPLGGMILGHLGDKYGRKKVFTLCLLLMSLPSLLIAFLPTYRQIGYFAPSLLICLRLCQGFSLGGEVPGSITYIAEKFKPNNYILACAWLTFGANIAVAGGSQLIYWLGHWLGAAAMHDYGWRIPFLCGSLLTVVGIYIRRSITESEAYQQLNQYQQVDKLPLTELLTNFRAPLIRGILLATIVSLSTSIFHVFLPNLLAGYAYLPLHTSQLISSSGALTLAIGSLFCAGLTKFIHPFLILRFSCCALSLIFALIFTSVITLKHASELYLWINIISLVLSGVNGLFFAILADLFPTRVRYSGVAFCYNIAYIIGAGITPLWSSTVLALTHSYHSIIGVCMVVAIIALLNTLRLQRLLLN